MRTCFHKPVLSTAFYINGFKWGKKKKGSSFEYKCGIYFLNASPALSYLQTHQRHFSISNRTPLILMLMQHFMQIMCLNRAETH